MGNLQGVGGYPSSTDGGTPQLPQPQPINQTVTTTPKDNYNVFPYTNAVQRLSDYEYYHHLLMGEHFEAFAIRINSIDYSKNYAKLRYIAANFPALISKISADMLFSEPISIKAPEDGDQDWLDLLMYENKINEQLYEAAIDSSALGDALFKVRVGKRHPNDNNATIIIEEITPTLYFPDINGFNIRSLPNQIELAWTFVLSDQKYLRKEIHKPGTIEEHVYEMDKGQITKEVDLSILGEDGLSGIGMVTDTGIERYLVVHVPNWKTGNRHFGVSDYYDLDKLFFAINNRLSKIDNILDKHSDPILLIPDGVIDEDGKVKREKLHMLEVPEGSGAKIKPEYIVWNANLEAAFMEIDKLLNVFMMTAEITPDVLGMGQGLNDSGRALKFKLMRTIAKAQRKKLYFDHAIKEVIYVAQLLAKAHDIGIGEDNIKLSGMPQMPEIIWQDGLPIDDYEEVTNEIAKIDAGIQSKRDAIMNLDDIDEEAADEKLEEIQEETKISAINTSYTAADFNDQTDAGNTDADNGGTMDQVKGKMKAQNTTPDKGITPTVNTPQQRKTKK